MQNQALTVISTAALAERALTLQDLVTQRSLIEKVIASVMKEGTHYGKIPGSQMPSLLKPGAQILCHLFRLRPEYDVEERELPRDHKSFKVRCRLFLIGSEPAIQIAEGWGEASTMESKHRFRHGDKNLELTEDPVPPMYWGIKKRDGWEAANDWLATAYDGRPVKAAKNAAGKFVVAIVTGSDAGKVENENPADVWNTVLKMACKRAYVDATITGTASNDFFTQDLEEMAENMEAIRKALDLEEAGVSAAATPEKPADNWEKVINHIGKKGGPILNKPIGKLDDKQREWLISTLQEKDEKRRSSQDKKLLAALLLWQAGKVARKQAADGEHTAAEEGNSGVNRNILAENLDWAQIGVEDFMRVARDNKWTAAENWAGITDEEAADLANRIDEVISICKEAANSGAK